LPRLDGNSENEGSLPKGGDRPIQERGRAVKKKMFEGKAGTALPLAKKVFKKRTMEKKGRLDLSRDTRYGVNQPKKTGQKRGGRVGRNRRTGQKPRLKSQGRTRGGRVLTRNGPSLRGERTRLSKKKALPSKMRAAKKNNRRTLGDCREGDLPPKEDVPSQKKNTVTRRESGKKNRFRKSARVKKEVFWCFRG